MTWPDLSALELLVAVCDHGSLSAGARAVGVAQPNASRSMARLERSLGLALLHRATTGTTLTPEGLMVVDWARSTLESARTLEGGVAALRSSTPVSRLAIMASQTVAEHLLPTWLATWQQHHPAHGISVAVGNTTDVLNATRAGDIDVGFIEGPGRPRGLNSTIVATDDLVLVVAPSHPWAGQGSVDAAELARTPLVTRESGSGTRVALQSALGSLAAAQPVLELTSNAAVRVSAAAGTAPAVLSRLTVRDSLTSGALVEVAVTGLDLHRNLRAVWSGPQRLANPAAEALIAVAARTSTTPAI